MAYSAVGDASIASPMIVTNLAPMDCGTKRWTILRRRRFAHGQARQTDWLSPTGTGDG